MEVGTSSYTILYISYYMGGTNLARLLLETEQKVYQFSCDGIVMFRR